MTETTKRVAMIDCHLCGNKTELRKGKKGFLYVNCTPPDGCGNQLVSRSLAADRRLAARAENWNCPETRAALIPATKPATPAPAPAPATPTTNTKAKDKSWLDLTL